MTDKHHEICYIVVDDDEDDRLLMRLALEQANRTLPVLEFEDGQALIDYLNQDTNSRQDKDMHWLVIMDVNMPRMDGFETIDRLKQNSYWAKLPVLMLSTSDDPATAQELIRRGANGYLTKPHTSEKFVELFDEFFAPWLNKDSNQWPDGLSNSSVV